MPFNILGPMTVAIVAIVFGTWAVVSLTKLVLNFFRENRYEDRSGSSLTSSELAHIVGSAVEEAIRPLEAKIDRLERRQRQLSSDEQMKPHQETPAHLIASERGAAE